MFCLQQAIGNFYCFFRFFVTPSDSVAIIAANAVDAIPYFSAGLKGVARFYIALFDFYCIQVCVHIGVVLYFTSCLSSTCQFVPMETKSGADVRDARKSIA